MFWENLGFEVWVAVVAVVAGAFGRMLKKLWSGMPTAALPVTVLLFGYCLMLGDQLLGGAEFLAGAKAALWGIFAAGGAVGGHEVLKKLLTPIVGEQLAEFILGKLESGSGPDDDDSVTTLPTKLPTALLVIAATLGPATIATVTGCPSVMSALATVAQGVSWLGNVLDFAEIGADKYFARHPSEEREAQVAESVTGARLALGILDKSTAAARSADDGDLAKARADTLAAYAELRDMLDTMGVLSATPPDGGAEANAPVPEPFELPTDEEATAHLAG